jgi:putative Mn2+ efflux pump MntP
MTFFSLLAIGFALSMDAFAVSVAEGVLIQERHLRHGVRTAGFFAAFQALMPLAGWAAGTEAQRLVAGVGHWIAFGILAGLGVKMVWESLRLEPAERRRSVMGFPTLLVLSLATSIDALAVGGALGVLQHSILVPIIIIGLVTFVVCLAGVFIGDRFGHLFESRIEIVAGVVLVLIGAKILIDHLSGEIGP